MRARVGVGVGVRGRVRGTSREHLVGLVEHEVVDVVHRQRAPVDHVKHAPRRAWSGLRSGQGQGQGQLRGQGSGQGSGSAAGSGEGSSVPTTSWTPERSLSMSWRTFVPPMQACRAGGGRGSRASASSAAPRTDRRVGRSGAASAAAGPVQRSGRVRACVRAWVSERVSEHMSS